jgi:hypothetical protein
LVVMFLQLSHHSRRGHLCFFCGPGLFGETHIGGRFLPEYAKLKGYSTPKYLVTLSFLFNGHAVLDA